MSTDQPKNFNVYQCLDCGKEVLNKAGCGAHASRAHKEYKLTDENFKIHFKHLRKPSPEMVNLLLKKQEYARKKYEKKKTKTPSSAPTPPKKSSSVQLLGLAKQPEMVSDGIILTVLVKIPIQFGIPEILKGDG
jgi:hypothetical protein